MTHLALRLLDWYKRRVSPRLGDRCRYDLGCADYMREAILKHGLARGTARGLRRLLSCGPWSTRPYSDRP